LLRMLIRCMPRLASSMGEREVMVGSLLPGRNNSPINQAHSSNAAEELKPKSEILGVSEKGSRVAGKAATQRLDSEGDDLTWNSKLKQLSTPRNGGGPMAQRH